MTLFLNSLLHQEDHLSLKNINSLRRTRMHSSRMRTGRTLTVFRWRTLPPKNLEECPPKKRHPPKFGGTPPKKRHPPKIWRNPPKIWRNPLTQKRPPPRKFGGPPKKDPPPPKNLDEPLPKKDTPPPENLEEPPKKTPPEKLEQNLEHPPL